MIVFPLIRSVGLKAATASSKAATLPMLVRRRPSRTRWTSSLNWARSGTTTKSIVKPSVGRASVGPVMVTSVPPARIMPADRCQGVAIEVDELLRAEVESRLTAGSAPGADDVRAGLTCELGRHRTDYAGRTVHKDALPRTKAAVLEQPLPRGQARHHKGRAHREVNIARQRCEVACLDGYILGQRTVAG